MATFNENILIRLLKARAYPLPKEGQVAIFGLRSYRPVKKAGQDISGSVEIEPSTLNYKKARCSIGIWKKGVGIAVFPGSTVPQFAEVEKHKNNPWNKVNQLVPGCYPDYAHGTHNPSDELKHRAVRQEGPALIRRTKHGQTTYGSTDPIYVDTLGYDPYTEGHMANDNIHCGRTYEFNAAPGETTYSSNGCQVIIGTTNPSNKETGPWKEFISRLKTNSEYTQPKYTYHLFSKEEVTAALSENWANTLVQITFGSYHKAAMMVQWQLKQKGYYHGDIDGDFRAYSVKALIEFEKEQVLGPEIHGATTPHIVSALGIELPTVDEIDLVNFKSLGPANFVIPVKIPESLG